METLNPSAKLFLFLPLPLLVILSPHTFIWAVWMPIFFPLTTSNFRTQSVLLTCDALPKILLAEFGVSLQRRTNASECPVKVIRRWISRFFNTKFQTSHTIVQNGEVRGENDTTTAHLEVCEDPKQRSWGIDMRGRRIVDSK